MKGEHRIAVISSQGDLMVVFYSEDFDTVYRKALREFQRAADGLIDGINLSYTPAAWMHGFVPEGQTEAQQVITP